MKKLFDNSNAFSSNGYSTVTDRTFMTSVAGFTLYGLVATFLATFFAPTHISTLAMVCGFIVPMIGCFVSMSEDLPIAFLGYNLIVIPFGLILGPVLNAYSPNVVANAVMITAIITGLMGFAGVTYPNLFRSLGGTLFYALLGLVVVRILQIFIPGLQGLSIIDYIAGGIFSLYIGYDMFRATEATRSVTSALHIAVSLYLDIINLFTIVLSILGNDRD